jgi:hypothetical protein
MNQQQAPINVAQVRERTKARWLSKQAQRVSFLDRIERSVPFWLVLIALAVFALSAPHTAATFNQLTPGLGWVAPLFVEFGLLYTAFRRKVLAQQNEKVPGIIWALEGLLFIVAIIVNGAGAFTAVISAVGLDHLSFGAMVEKFGTLPAGSQVALVLVPVAAFIIPIGTVVAGEGLAALVLERRQVEDTSEDRWAAVSSDVLYTAFFDALIAAGCSPAKARHLAAAYAVKPEKTEGAEESGKSGRGGKKWNKAVQFLVDNPRAVLEMNGQDLAEATGISKTVAYEVLAEFKAKANGHVGNQDESEKQKPR